jgi:ankyrin repeat protein
VDQPRFPIRRSRSRATPDCEALIHSRVESHILKSYRDQRPVTDWRVQLLRHGANLHHFTRRPEGSTALHEAVARGKMKMVDVLLQYGANPFMENGR